MQKTLSARNLRSDDFAAILRWLDDNTYLSAFAQERLSPIQIQLVRQRLRTLLDAGNSWIVIHDNIRIAFVFSSEVFGKASGMCDFFLVPRLRLDWSLAEGEILKLISNKSGIAEQSLHNLLSRRSHAMLDAGQNDNPQRGIEPVRGKSALILGPRERNRRPIASLGKAGFAVVQSMNHDEDHGGRTFDLVISSGYDRRLPPSFVDRYQDKIINLHAARLPWGRGIGTTLFALLLDYPLGVSIHFIDSGLDTGDLIAESDVEPTNEDTLRTVYTSMLEETNLLFDSALKSLLAGTASRREQQEIPQRAFARSRADFEDVMKIMPNGYDTALVDVKSLGNSMRALHSARRWLGEQV